MLRHRCASGLKKKLYLRSGSQRHFIGFFNVPVQVPTRGHPFYGYSEKPPHLVAFYDTLGIWRTYSHLKPRCPHGGGVKPQMSGEHMALSFYIKCVKNLVTFTQVGCFSPIWKATSRLTLGIGKSLEISPRPITESPIAWLV